MTPDHADTMRQLAKQLFDALQDADSETLLEIYAPSASLWTHGRQRPVDAALLARFLPKMKDTLPERKYEARRMTVLPNGFVHQHRLVGRRKDGAETAVECCAIVTVENKTITRIEEYVDSRQLDAVMTQSQP